MVKADLHTHSIDSHDGGISYRSYIELLEAERLDVIAITDHSSIGFAQKIANDEAWGKHIIVGQEIMTTEGEIIGLFLNKLIADGDSPKDTVRQIRLQDGFVLVPHPEDKHRSGLSIETMDRLVEDIDAVEAHNGRQFGKPKADVRHWAKQNNVAIVACSDAHSKLGVGRTYTMLESAPDSAQELREQLANKSRLAHDKPPLLSLLAPKLNRLRRHR